MKKKILFQCSICKEKYTKELDAMNCEKQELDKRQVEVGDIVKAKGGFGWFDGDKRWVINPNVKANPKHGNCFGECCTMTFYYVVTAIDNEGHRVRYHLFTKAMTGKQGYAGGYTFNSGHLEPIEIKRPPQFIIKDSRNLIGRKSENLL